jgi:L-threonylcarbamoyladenylate synthase
MSILSINNNEEAALEQACSVLAAGGLIALPTETVYGLAADATNGEAVARIFETKGRPHFNPLICHVSSLDMARQYVTFNEMALALARAFWPGPLTLVLPLKTGTAVHPLTSAGLDTLAVRVPGGFARDLIGRYGRPLAAPSANTSGKISATRAEHVEADLGDRVDLTLDGGAAPIGLESTILKPLADRVELLRPGGLAAEDIERVAGCSVTRRQNASTAIEAPGMLRSHYAPETTLQINAETAVKGDAVITFAGRRLPGDENASLVLDLSPKGDLREAAANLFDHMKTADASDAARISVVAIPGNGLGEAINDRLVRAAAPTDETGVETTHD